MSHNKLVYKVYPDNEAYHIDESRWRNANHYLNGYVVSFDFNEAWALAKMAVKHTKYPMIIEEINWGGVGDGLCHYWRIDV
jgi:hypothetical protein